MKYRFKTDFKTRPPKPFKHKNDVYYIRQVILGKDVWRSLGTKNQKEADIIAYRMWYAQQSIPVKNILEEPENPLSNAWDEYVKSEKYTLLEESTQATRKRAWQAFENWLGKQNIENLESLLPEHCQAYLEKCGKKNKTFNNVRNDLRQILGTLCSQTKRENPFGVVQAKTIKRGDKASDKYRAFSQKEIKDILEAIAASKMRDRDEWYAACQIATQTGLRFKDIALLRWDSVKKDHIELVPHKTESKNEQAVLIKKTNLLRLVLARLPHKKDFVLPGLAKNYNAHNSSLPFMRILKGLNIKTVDPVKGKAGFHSFRTTVVTLAGQAGVDMKLLGGVLGHTEESQTKHYNRAAINLDLSFLENVEKRRTKA